MSLVKCDLTQLQYLTCWTCNFSRDSGAKFSKLRKIFGRLLF